MKKKLLFLIVTAAGITFEASAQTPPAAIKAGFEKGGKEFSARSE
ncbi:hypothetical protein [Filimonas lacunae]|nr:hypothetical protein [Filimonas lacunae]BAV05501.1 hypothetical protein FLA_1508 [Filimonas lacunae]